MVGNSKSNRQTCFRDSRKLARLVTAYLRRRIHWCGRRQHQKTSSDFRTQKQVLRLMLLACPTCCYIRIEPDIIVLVDPEDWIDLHKNKWYVKKGKHGWYAYRKIYRNGKQYREYMHRVIMATPKGQECHHKFGNTLDNRKENLQNVTPKIHGVITQFNRICKRRYRQGSRRFEDLPREKVLDFP